MKSIYLIFCILSFSSNVFSVQNCVTENGNFLNEENHSINMICVGHRLGFYTGPDRFVGSGEIVEEVSVSKIVTNKGEYSIEYFFSEIVRGSWNYF